jgi:hypothetical protein
MGARSIDLKQRAAALAMFNTPVGASFTVSPVTGRAVPGSREVRRSA